MGQGPDPPLPARNYFQGPVALFEKLDGMGNGTRLAAHLARGRQKFDHPPLRRGQVLAGQFIAVDRGPGRAQPVGGRRRQAPVTSDDGPHGQAQLPPPGHVRDVAESAHHRRTGALVGLS